MLHAGVIAPMATPMTVEGDVDDDQIRRRTRFLEAAGVHGVFPCGSTGEFASLTVEERTQVVATVAEAASGPVLAGCCDTALPAVLEQLKLAAEAGADAGVVVSPYYMPTTEASHRAFFEHVADRATIPLYLYNVPRLAGHGLDVESVCSLAAHDRIVGVKDTTGDLLRVRRLVDRTPDDFAVFTGVSTQFHAALSLGADGLIGGSVDVLPEVLGDLYTSHVDGNHERAARISRDVLLPLVDAYSTDTALANLKFLIGEAGPGVGTPRPPVPGVEASDVDDLREVLETSLDAYEALSGSPSEPQST